MSDCPKCRKMVFGSNAASSTLVRIALNILIIASSLILVSARRVPSTDAADIIEFSLEEGVHIKGKVPVDSKVQLKCPYEEPIWFKNGVKLGVEMRRMRMITFEKIKKPDTGTYACRSDLDRWSNLTLAVVPERDMSPSFGANVQVLSQINGNFSEVNNKHDIEHPNQGHEKDAHNNFDLDDIGDDAHFDDGKTENIKGSPPTWKNESTLTHTLAKPSGSFIKLSCAPLGNPKPNITWTKNDKPIVRTIGKVAMKKWTIQMEDVISDDSGQYKCKVCNTYGCIEHTTKLFIQDRVNHKPIILHHPKNLTLAVGENGKFNCSILSDLHHAVGWSFKHCPKTICPIGDNSTVIKTDPERSDILTLENVSYDDEGWYTCVAANSLGHTKASAYLHVVDELFDNAVPISSPIKNNSIWISVVAFLVGFSFLFGTILMVFISRKLKQEKLMKHRMETVHQWTKKVIIYKPSTDPSSPETMVMPIIKIEKQRTTLLQSSNTDPAPFNEYEFPLDSNWEIPRNHLTLGATLGEGAFGRVVMAEATGLAKNQGSCIVAVKMVKEGHTDADMASLVREMEVMKMIGKHINIINLLGCCSQDGPLYVIVEYAPHGNLKDFLKKNRPTSEFEAFTFDEKERRSLTQKDLISFAFQVARGMEYLASRRCIHRDLAARNVLVSDDYIIKIADFGLARDIQDTDYYRKNTNGRLPIKWMAPESLQDKFYDTQSDVWSYGVLLWEIMTYGEQPYPSVMSAEELYNYLMSGQRMEKPPRCSLNIYMLMRQCWNFDAHARPTFTEIVENLDKILTATANANEEYLDLGVPLLETPPSSDEESDTDTLRETTLLRYKS